MRLFCRHLTLDIHLHIHDELLKHNKKEQKQFSSQKEGEILLLVNFGNKQIVMSKKVEDCITNSCKSHGGLDKAVPRVSPCFTQKTASTRKLQGHGTYTAHLV